MTRRIARISTLLLLTICAGCASIGTMSKKLEVGMSEPQVKRDLGEPTSVSVSTCGSKTAEPWQCKQYKYEDGWTGFLIVYFSQVDGEWLVNSWSAY